MSYIGNANSIADGGGSSGGGVVASFGAGSPALSDIDVIHAAVTDNGIAAVATSVHAAVADNGIAAVANSVHTAVADNGLHASVDSVHLAVTDNGAPQVVNTVITNPTIPAQVSATAGGVATDIGAISVTVIGTDVNDGALTEILPAFTVNTAGTVNSVGVFKTVTEIDIPAHDGLGATTSIGNAIVAGTTQTVTTGLTSPSIPARVSATSGGTAGDIGSGAVVVTGTGTDNAVLTETLPVFTANAPTTVVGSLIFKTVTSVAVPASDGDGATTAIGNAIVLGTTQTITTGITDPSIPAAITATVAGTAADVAAVSVTITGTDASGLAQTEVLPAFVLNNTGTATGTKVFATVLSISLPGHDGSGVNVSIGNAAALGIAQTLTPTTQPDVPRVISATAGGTGGDIAAVSVIVHGTDTEGAVISETLPAFTVNTAGTKTGVKSFVSVTSFTVPGMDGSGATVSLGTGPSLGLPVRLSRNSVMGAFLDGIKEATAPTVVFDATNISGNTVLLSSTLNGKSVIVDYYDS
jgi:hypothetical protein